MTAQIVSRHTMWVSVCTVPASEADDVGSATPHYARDDGFRSRWHGTHADIGGAGQQRGQSVLTTTLPVTSVLNGDGPVSYTHLTLPTILRV